MYLYLGVLTVGVFLSGGMWTVICMTITPIEKEGKPKPIERMSLEEAKSIVEENNRIITKSIETV